MNYIVKKAEEIYKTLQRDLKEECEDALPVLRKKYLGE